MTAFVSVSKQPLSVSELQNLIKELAIAGSYYFLRCPHKVSGIVDRVPTDEDFPMVEGQMFNREFELRWRQKSKDSYDVIHLSIEGNCPRLIPTGESWEFQDRDAYLHSNTEVRFPKSFSLNNEQKIGQRYFKNAKTATVHFVALTVK